MPDNKSDFHKIIYPRQYQKESFKLANGNDVTFIAKTSK